MGLTNLLKGHGIWTRLRRLLLPRYWLANRRYRIERIPPSVIFVAAMPRTGSTLVKRYLGEGAPFTYESSAIAANRPANEHPGATSIQIMKNTALMGQVWDVFREFGNEVWFLGVVRDPRDQLVSLLETDRHQEMPRDPGFWRVWLGRYSDLLRFAEEHRSKATRVALVRYEDLARKPVEVKSSFLQWLGIGRSAGALSPDYYNTVDAIAQQEDKSEDWKCHQQNRVHPNSVGRWRSFEDSRTSDLLLSCWQDPAVAELMEHFGYGRTGLESISRDFPGIDLLPSASS